jgi:hypothetical protein
MIVLKLLFALLILAAALTAIVLCAYFATHLIVIPLIRWLDRVTGWGT